MDKPLVTTFIVPNLRKSVQDFMQKALQGTETSNYELEFRTKSNGIRYLLVNAMTRQDADGNIVGVVGVAQDVTKAAKIDRAVGAMAWELRQLVDTTIAPIFGIDVHGNVNEWNDTTAEITGFSKEEAMDKPLVTTFSSTPSMELSKQPSMELSKQPSLEPRRSHPVILPVTRPRCHTVSPPRILPWSHRLSLPWNQAPAPPCNHRMPPVVVVVHSRIHWLRLVRSIELLHNRQLKLVHWLTSNRCSITRILLLRVRLHLVARLQLLDELFLHLLRLCFRILLVLFLLHLRL